jgi:signal peptidase I
MILRRFFSAAIREAVAMRKHVQRLLNAQRDVLSPQALAAVQTKIDELNAAIAEGTNTGRIRNQTEDLQFAAEKWIKPYPNPVWRENVEVLLVAIAVAMGIRTFFLQPFKIPTGSMQPTLYGVNSVPDYTTVVRDAEYAETYGLSSQQQDMLQANVKKLNQQQKDLIIPTGWQRIKEWFEGASYLHVVAQADGTIDPNSFQLRKFLIFNIKQTFAIGGVQQTIWFPPDFGEEDLRYRAGMFPGKVYQKGDDIVKMKVTAGDHLFVDRLTYNFRKPERGDVVVFETKGIPDDQRFQWRIPADEFYIKRLVGLSGETISLKQDYLILHTPQGDVPAGHLIVNGQPLSASSPHFENLYSFNGAKEGTNTLVYQENQYFGHAMIQRLAPGQEVQIARGNSFMMGDNTMNSLDSRYWGDIPSSSIIGKSFFVYWPLTKRFGVDNQ